MDNQPLQLNRRTIAKGIAWSAPAIALVSVTPAIAASGDPARLVQKMLITRVCEGMIQPTVTQINIDGRPENAPHGSRGIWILNTRADSVITKATLTFTFPTDIVVPKEDAEWQIVSPSQKWSKPEQVGDTEEGHLYRTSYSGNWIFHPATGSTPAYSIPEWPPILEVATGWTNAIQSYCRTKTFTASVDFNAEVDGVSLYNQDFVSAQPADSPRGS